MKYTWLFLALAATVACNSKPAKQAESKAPAADTAKDAFPVMTFEKESHNFGNITEGEVVAYAFKFFNTGKKDLIITRAEASCGCTVPEWPKEPIKPGDSGYMKVKFDSKGRPEGYTEKEIFIQANTKEPMINGPKIQCTITKK